MQRTEPHFLTGLPIHGGPEAEASLLSTSPGGEHEFVGFSITKSVTNPSQCWHCRCNVITIRLQHFVPELITPQPFATQKGNPVTTRIVTFEPCRVH